MSRPDELPIRWGFSLDHLERLARIATRRAFTAGLDPAERYATAWHGIVVALFEAVDPPSPRALVAAGGRAITQAAEAEQAYLGYNQRDVWQGSMASSRFQKYWNRGTAPSPEDIIDPIALAQVWPMLSLLEQQTITLLALLESYAEAATAAGVSYATYHQRLARARASFFKWWFQPETPAKVTRDQRVPSRRPPTDPRPGRRL